MHDECMREIHDIGMEWHDRAGKAQEGYQNQLKTTIDLTLLEARENRIAMQKLTEAVNELMRVVRDRVK
jgi:hypothetical protein